MNIEQIFGTVLQEHRLSSKMSQEELAFNSGLDRTYISLLERGKRKPTINTLFSLAGALNIHPSQLIKELEQRLSEGQL
ncbi:XRE family transcriptional regulator [Bacillus manliponensis]|uniref:XRE family transcriptional regulator n=1 Tax=Bacillus manliponensis TaxID=574376 RepID=A0A073K0G6_9BACI|nr:helix-turn-helix transcriptional regulator [Bacillus manliponensis]KEK19917.1 XRE family transcriptional regulator [Bacillus manliponensis]